MRVHLAHAGELTLDRAYKLGRKALNQGLGVVDVAALYHRGLARVLCERSARADCTKSIKSLGSLFIESLSPYEMTHRGYREAQITLRHLNELLEDQAKKIAHALHDESGQLLLAVRLGLAELETDLPPGSQERMQRVMTVLDEMEEQLRRLSQELRPLILDDLGLLPALQSLTEGFSRRTGINVILEVFWDDRLPPRVEVALYRIVQEALTNASKHARASQIVIQMQGPSKALLTCSIRDNGAGFDVSRVLNTGIKRGLGLPGIRERLRALDAELEIKSSPGHGTELVFQVPIEN